MNVRYQSVNLSRDTVKVLGRGYFDGDRTLGLGWCDSGFAFRFRGTGAIFHFEPFPDGEPAYVKVWLDGRPQRFAVATGKEKIILETDSTDRGHEVRFLRVTESPVPLRVSGLTLTGNAPVLLEKPADKKIFLEFLGDSITMGFGVTGPCDVLEHHWYEEDSSRSYAFRTAELLDADIAVSGISGRGVVADCNGDRTDWTMLQCFRTRSWGGEPYAFDGRIPDVMIVNAGTNDQGGGISDEEFRPAAVELLKNIRETYPGVPIVYCYGLMDREKLSAIEGAVSDFDRCCGNVWFLPMESIAGNPEEFGSVGHPNTNASERVARILSAKLREILGIA